MQKVVLASQKDGVGKTAATVNIGVALVSRGKRVLLVDLAPHASSGLCLLGSTAWQVEKTIYHGHA